MSLLWYVVDSDLGQQNFQFLHFKLTGSLGVLVAQGELHLLGLAAQVGRELDRVDVAGTVPHHHQRVVWVERQVVQPRGLLRDDRL